MSNEINGKGHVIRELQKLVHVLVTGGTIGDINENLSGSII
jgi:hypothetical protein